MKKRIWLVLSAAVLLLLLVACKDDHEHMFGEWSITIPATCVTEGVQTRTCECGESETNAVPATGVHIYSNENVCSMCGVGYGHSEGLLYTANSEGTAYTVTGIGTATDSRVVIPPYHNKLPVTGFSGLVGADTTVTVRGIDIPATMLYISAEALYGCNELESITVSEENTAYKSMDNCLIEIASGTLVAGCKSSVIPNDDSVVTIGSLAFAGRKGLASITLPVAVTTIGPRAFEECTDLTTVIFSGKPGFDTAGSAADNPNGLYIGEWYVSETTGALEGTKVDVESEAANATQLKDIYVQCYWYRNSGSDDSIRY